MVEKDNNERLQSLGGPMFDKMMQKGSYRKKQGVIKNERQLKFYYDDNKE